jgi:PAS domain S-box-containing protein
MSHLSSPARSDAGPTPFDPETAAWFFAQSLDLFAVADRDATILQVNPAWETRLGWRAEEVIGRSLYDFAHPDDGDAMRAAEERGRTQGSAEETFRLKTADGGWRWFAVRAHAGSDGRLLGVLRDVTDQRQEMEEIAQLRQAHGLVAMTAGVSTWTLDPATMTFHYPEAEAAAAETGAFMLTDVAALKDCLAPEDHDRVRDLIASLMMNGGQGETVVRVLMEDRGVQHFRVSYRAAPHPSGRFAIHALSQNITSLVEAQEAMRRSEQMVRQMVEKAPFAAALFDKDLRHRVTSDAWRTVLGGSETEFLGRTLHELFPRARTRFITAQKRALAGETVERTEDRLVSSDGRLRWVRWQMQPWRDLDGRICGVLAYMSDISALVAARREAQSNARRLRLAVGAAGAAVFEVDYAAGAVWFGPNFARLAGRELTYEEMCGLWPNVHPDDREAVQHDIAAFDTRRPKPLECRLVHPDGSARWIQAHMEVVHDALGRPRRSVGLLLDIDARKRQELALAEAERQATVATEAKSRFLANISHEIRTPMNGVLGVLQLIKRESLDQQDRALIEEGLASGRMLTELLDDLLDFSKIEAGQFELRPELLDPAQILVGITTLLSPAASAKGLTMTATAEPGLGLIKADPLRLRQALYNIMGNAVKFTPSGSVEARLARCEAPGGPRLRFEVQDTGIGVAEDAQATLFERFEQADGSMTRKYGGSGLGLAITKRLAEMMGGSVGFTSRPGEGSTFWMEIGGEELAAPAAADEDPADIGEFRVLLVEDNPTNRLVISKLLQALGVVVECAEDGAAGVAAAAKGGYDLVLMDIQMPGMDGLEATRRIRAMDGPVSTTPVVAITANVLAEQKSSYEAAGMDGVVSKPVSAAALLSEIARVTERRAA